MVNTRAGSAKPVGSLRAQNRGVIEALHRLEIQIATTNYDGLIEEVTGLPTVTWMEDAKVEQVIRGDDRGVLHIHGYGEKPESVILGVRSYQQIMTDAHAQNVLRALQTMKTLLFVGFGTGLRDPNFSTFLQWTATVFRQSQYRRFRLAKEDEVEDSKESIPLSKGSSSCPLERNILILQYFWAIYRHTLRVA